VPILSVSMPPALRKVLDAEARRQGRSRSFVVSEAVRAYVAQRERDAFADARDRTLREGLALSPAERVRLSDGDRITVGETVAVFRRALP